MASERSLGWVWLTFGALAASCVQSEGDYTHAFTGHESGEERPVEPPAPPPRVDASPEVACGPTPELPSGCLPVCAGGRWLTEPAPDAPDEICNGADDDCDGAVDEELSGACCLGDSEPPCNGLSGGVVRPGWVYAAPADGVGPLRVMAHEVTRARWARYAGTAEPPGNAAPDDFPVSSVDLYTAMALANAVAAGVPGGEPCYLASGGRRVSMADLPALRDGALGRVSVSADCAGPRLPTLSEFARLYDAGWPPAAELDCVPTARCPGETCARGWCTCGPAARVRAVGGRLANRLGVHDLAGNVAEWVWPDGVSTAPEPDGFWPVAGGSASSNAVLDCGWNRDGLPVAEALKAWDPTPSNYLFTGIRLVWAGEPSKR